MQIERGRTDEKEAAAQALARDVAKATLAEIQGMFARDMEILKLKLPGKADQAAETARDVKYLRDRQQSLSSARWLLICALSSFGDTNV